MKVQLTVWAQTVSNLTSYWSAPCYFPQRLHTFRHSRVSHTAKQEGEDQPQVIVTDQREQLQFQAAIPENVSPPSNK